MSNKTQQTDDVLEDVAQADPVGPADAPEQNLDAEVKKPEAQADPVGQAPEQPPKAAEPTPEPAAPPAGPRANVRLVVWPTLPEHFGTEIRTKRDALAAQAEATQGAYQEAAVDRQALVDAARSDGVQAKALHAAIDRAFDSLMKAHAARRAYDRAALAFCDEVRDYAREQNARDSAEVQEIRAKIDAAYTKVGKSHWHQGNVNGHPDVKSAEARKEASWRMMQPHLFSGGAEGSLEQRFEADLVSVNGKIEQLVLEFAGWA